MIKQETRVALREKPLEYHQAMLRFLYSIMSADDFAGAFWNDVEQEWTGDAEAIADAFEADLPEPEDELDAIDPAEADRLHAAICEGRRDDAIEILNDIAGERFMSIREQHNLFPDRVPA